MVAAGTPVRSVLSADTPALPQQSPIDIRADLVHPSAGLPELKVRYSTDTTVRAAYIRKDATDPAPTR